MDIKEAVVNIGKRIKFNRPLDEVLNWDGDRISSITQAELKGFDHIYIEYIDEDGSVKVTGGFYIKPCCIELYEEKDLPQAKEMDWKEVLTLFVQGVEVQALSSTGNWHDILEYHFKWLVTGDVKFRIKPKTVKLDGEYTEQNLHDVIAKMNVED